MNSALTPAEAPGCERDSSATSGEAATDQRIADSGVSATRSRWVLPADPAGAVAGLAAELALPVWTAQLLAGRGLITGAAVRAFLEPSWEQLHDPLRFDGMRVAVSRILSAVRNGEPILIYGDYDVDGTLATVLLKTAIDRVTPKARNSLVRYHIPHRIREGYGVQTAVLGDAAAEGVRLVVSVDTGIRAFAAAAEAKLLGIDLIVTDHHLPEACGVPEAVAVINPNQRDCAYPFKELCGAAVAFKLAEALLRTVAGGDADGLEPVDPKKLEDLLLPSLLKLVCIATVADAVPLLGENRVLVALGLRELKDPRQPGLRALMRLADAGRDGTPPTATELGFRLGPRINAAGRMDVAGDVVRLLLTRDAAEGQALAEKLHRLNDQRREVEKAVLQSMEAELTKIAEAATECGDCLVMDGVGWHRGVVGILASRVVERTQRPALVITHEEGKAHGSGRSIAGFHLLDAVTAAHLEHGSTLFDRFGGHAHAVGFSMPSEHVPRLRTSLSRYAREQITPQMMQRVLRVDAELHLGDVSADTLEKLRRLEPFGQGNPEPVFAARAVVIAEMSTLKDRHLKLRLKGYGANAVSCLCWSRGTIWPERFEQLGLGVGSVVDIAFQLHENRHPEYGGPELQLCDVRHANPS